LLQLPEITLFEYFCFGHRKLPKNAKGYFMITPTVGCVELFQLTVPQLTEIAFFELIRFDHQNCHKMAKS
jgi:hypothetical protein